MEEIKKTGGAIVGGVTMSRPFATLTVNKNKLQLNASIYGTLIFRPGDVISIEPYHKVLSSGVRINHYVPGYNPNVIFLTRQVDELLNEIEQTGFLNNTSILPASVEAEFADVQTNGAFPLKISAAIMILLVFNGLIISNYFFFPEKVYSDIPLTGLGLSSVFILILAILLLTSGFFREAVLKKGRSIDSFRSFIYLTILVTLFMLLVVSFFPA